MAMAMNIVPLRESAGREARDAENAGSDRLEKPVEGRLATTAIGVLSLLGRLYRRAAPKGPGCDRRRPPGRICARPGPRPPRPILEPPVGP